MKTIVNDSSKPGARAGAKTIFGDFNRYAVYPVHTRHIPGITDNRVSWFVEDAETIDPVTGLLEIVRQASSKEEAMAGLI